MEASGPILSVSQATLLVLNTQQHNTLLLAQITQSKYEHATTGDGVHTLMLSQLRQVQLQARCNLQ